jgi:type IV pilus assembly protein PilA
MGMGGQPGYLKVLDHGDEPGGPEGHDTGSLINCHHQGETMLESLRKRLEKDEEGFTLIELMVVVLIIAILIAIAIPTFLGARQRAQDRAAQSNIRNAFTAEKVFYTDAQSYTTDVASLTGIEPSLTFAADAVPATVGTIYVDVDTNGVVTLGAKSASGSCFYLQDSPTGSTGTQYSATDSSGCVAPSGATVDQPSW